MNSYGWCLSNLHSVIGALLFCVSVLLLVSIWTARQSFTPVSSGLIGSKWEGVVEPREKMRREAGRYLWSCWGWDRVSQVAVNVNRRYSKFEKVL
jgi:hypothetical protein